MSIHLEHTLCILEVLFIVLYIVQLGFCLDYHDLNLLDVMIMANFTEIHGTQYFYSSKRNCDLNQCCMLDESFFIFLELAIILIQCCLVYLCFTS